MLTSRLKRCLALAILIPFLGAAAALCRFRPGRSAPASSRRKLLLVGTFHNPGWFRSHVSPLSMAGVFDEILLVTDQPLMPAPRVSYRCPPSWLSSCTGRWVARFVWILVVAARERPGVSMGYHIMPNAVLCLLTARMFGGAAIYQNTGGPVQLVGGGFACGNAVLRQLGAPSRIVERLMYRLVGEFDVNIVRGTSARRFLDEHGLSRATEIITGSVDTDAFLPAERPPDIDIVCVSRLASNKGLEHFLQLTSVLAGSGLPIRAVVVGGGPLRAELEEQSRVLGISPNIEFVGQLDSAHETLRRAKVFVLLSASEGLSIAMLEAMAAGLPVVVYDVGDLKDAVTPGETGELVSPGDLETAAARVGAILADPELHQRMSECARARVVEHYSLEVVAERWRNLFEPLLRTPAGRSAELHGGQ